MSLSPSLALAAEPAADRAPLSFSRSTLARRIVVVNLAGLMIVVAAALSVTYLREGLVQERERALLDTARLLAGVVGGQPVAEAAAAAARLPLPEAARIVVVDPAGRPVAAPGLGIAGEGLDLARPALGEVMAGATRLFSERDAGGQRIVAVAAPLAAAGGGVSGALILATGAGEIDALIGRERLQLLRMVVVAGLVSLGLSLVLASAIATPLSRLAAAAEAGRGSGGRSGMGRVRIPDLTHRSDEIGRLSAALRTMVGTLYQRLEANEQFAADVAHELKNPLASLRSAVSTMRVMTRDEHREQLIAIIEHDVRRLDRLVSDIASASRLDSELVREEEAEFDLNRTLTGLCDHFCAAAEERGILLTCDLPAGAIPLRGLEPRLAQVFVNLLGNALSFCEAGDAIRVWCRHRDGRVLVVVEDTGPGIPPESLARIFGRFYSERPAGQFGEHSGLGLAISRQIVEAHGGVIWAENVVPTPADPGSEPMGARFVVGLRG